MEIFDISQEKQPNKIYSFGEVFGGEIRETFCLFRYPLKLK